MYNRFTDSRHIKWAKSVKKRDEYACCICNSSGVELHSHHINSYDWCDNLRFDVDNGICLCRSCHQRFHEIYNYGNNTYDQFLEFKEIMKSFKKNIEESI